MTVEKSVTVMPACKVSDASDFDGSLRMVFRNQKSFIHDTIDWI